MVILNRNTDTESTSIIEAGIHIFMNLLKVEHNCHYSVVEFRGTRITCFLGMMKVVSCLHIRFVFHHDSMFQRIQPNTQKLLQLDATTVHLHETDIYSNAITVSFHVTVGMGFEFTFDADEQQQPQCKRY